MAQDLVTCESVFPDRSLPTVQASSAVALGEDISSAHQRGAPPWRKHLLPEKPQHWKAGSAPSCPEWAGEK